MQNGGVVYLVSHVPHHGETSTHVLIVDEMTVWLILVSTVDKCTHISLVSEDHSTPGWHYAKYLIFPC